MDDGWQGYHGEDDHTSHIHFSFDWAGAEKRTSWWTGKVAPIEYGPCRKYIGDPVPAYGDTINLEPCPKPIHSPSSRRRGSVAGSDLSTDARRGYGHAESDIDPGTHRDPTTTPVRRRPRNPPRSRPPRPVRRRPRTPREPDRTTTGQPSATAGPTGSARTSAVTAPAARTLPKGEPMPAAREMTPAAARATTPRAQVPAASIGSCGTHAAPIGDEPCTCGAC